MSKPENHTTLLQLKGRLAYGNELQALKTDMAALLSQQGEVLVLDLSQVEYADSSGIGALLYLDGLAKEHGSALRIAGATRRVLEVLRMTHTDKILTLE